MKEEAVVNMLARVRRLVDELPLLMRVGLVTAVLGGVIDVAHHATADATAVGHGSVAFAGHLVTLLGMVITMVGLLGAAFSRRFAEAKRNEKGDSV